MEVVSVDIGGTHARFAIAEVADGRVVSLAEPVTLKTAEYAGFQTAWEAFGAQAGRPLPRAAAIAVASPISGDVIKLTNNPWVIRPPLIKERLKIDEFVLINDFGAVGQAVAQVEQKDFLHLCGPDVAFPDHGVITVCGPGTGLGVAQVFRTPERYHVLETEGGHVDFAPLDGLEDAMVKRLRTNYTRVSTERIVSGPGIVAIYETLADIEHRSITRLDDKAIWTAALDEGNSLAVAALDRFCMSLGAVAGDLALAHGSSGVVIAGGLGLRLKDHIRKSGFAERFTAKGRFQGRMSKIPVKLITYPQPGLFGAAAAFAQEHTR
jgi:glucokinase